MNKFLKFFIIFSLILLGAFTIYVKLLESRNERPTIYIDNFSGSKIKIVRKNKMWIELENESSLVRRDLKQGTYFLYIHKEEGNLRDTIRIDVKKKKKYVLNLFQGMTYVENNLTYQTRLDNDQKQAEEATIISKRFFETKADFIFEKPSNHIDIRSKNTPPNSLNIKIRKRYLRRKSQVLE